MLSEERRRIATLSFVRHSARPSRRDDLTGLLALKICRSVLLAVLAVSFIAASASHLHAQSEDDVPDSTEGVPSESTEPSSDGDVALPNATADEVEVGSSRDRGSKVTREEAIQVERGAEDADVKASGENDTKVLIQYVPREEIPAVDPSTIAAQAEFLSVEQLRATTPEQRESITPEFFQQIFLKKSEEAITVADVETFFSGKIHTVPDELVPQLSQQAVAKFVGEMRPAQLTLLRTEQLSLLTPDQTANVQDARQVGRLNVARNLGVKIVGDALASLETKASEEAAAFGAGLELQAEKYRLVMFVAKGSKPQVLTDRREMGLSILQPQVQDWSVSLAVDSYPSWWEPKHVGWVLCVVLFPCAIHHIMRDRGEELMTASTASVDLGLFLRASVGLTDWAHIAAPIEDGDETTPEYTSRFSATTFKVVAGLKPMVAIASGDNFVELGMKFGAGVFGFDLDSSDGGDKDAFLTSTLTTTKRMFFGIETGLGFRVNSIIVSADVFYTVTQADVPGFSSLHFIPSLTLRAGPEIVDFDGD